MDRRGFIKVCASVAALSLPPLFLKDIAIGGTFKRYKKALLVDGEGKPLDPSRIEEGKEYIFFYPYRSTPCMLINTGKKVEPATLKLESGETYRWEGGVGPDKSIVAYVAICTHQLSFIRPDNTFINYYPPGTKSGIVKRDRVIQCCAHLSVFDPEKGASVIDGPAKDPLPAVVLSVEDDRMYAVGILGKDLFADFFDAYRSELKEIHGTFRKAKQKVERCEVVELNTYTKNLIRC